MLNNFLMEPNNKPSFNTNQYLMDVTRHTLVASLTANYINEKTGDKFRVISAYSDYYFLESDFHKNGTKFCSCRFVRDLTNNNWTLYYLIDNVINTKSKKIFTTNSLIEAINWYNLTKPFGQELLEDD